MKVLSAALIFLVRVYQSAISPLFGGNCRFAPTCSQYTVQAIGEWGPFKGTWLGMKRIAKCHPWGGHGYDPVPRKNYDAKNDGHIPENQTGAEGSNSSDKHLYQSGGSAAS